MVPKFPSCMVAMVDAGIWNFLEVVAKPVMSMDEWVCGLVGGEVVAGGSNVRSRQTEKGKLC